MRTRGYVEPIDVPRDGPPGMDTKPRSKPAKGKATAGRFQVLNQFVDQSARLVGSTAVATWLVLYRETKPDGTATISHNQIGELLGIKRRTAMRATQDLIDAGLLVVTKRGHATGHTPSTYRIKSAPK